ncbi:MAG: accessory gene regulator B family protein [Solobacterium sp.]|nr:accessory gene regulator B family protein [Solobacterium sp.]
MNLKNSFNISVKLEYFLTDNILLSEYDTLLLKHGISILLQDGSEILSALIIGSCFGKLIETALFLICFCTLRIHSGGLHAKTPTGCYFGFMLIFSSVLIICSFDIPEYVSVIISIISAVFIILEAPAEHPLNPLTPAQKISARKHVLYLSMISLIGEMLLLFQRSCLIEPITAALFMNCLLMNLLKYSECLKGRKDACQ